MTSDRLLLLFAPRSSTTSKVIEYSPACTVGCSTRAALLRLAASILPCKDGRLALVHEKLVRKPFSASELREPLRICSRTDGTMGAGT